jgi:peptidoglycan/LPS O-acetylase OafA/YrhL
VNRIVLLSLSSRAAAAAATSVPPMAARLTDRTQVSRNVAYVPGVDHLRGMAAILMVLYHGYQQLGDKVFVRAGNPLEAVLIEGHTAVALFMVLSGFIFTYGALDHEVQYRPFMLNRVLRIVPMYVLVVLLAVYTSPAGYSFTGVLQLFTLQGTPPIAEADLGPFGALLWTISVEFAFYLVFPFLLRFLRAYGPRYLVGLVLMMNLLRLLAAGVNPQATRDIAYWTIIGRIDQFLIGMFIGWLVVRRSPALSRGRAWAGVALAALAVVVALNLFNRNGSWYDTSTWKAFWPSVEGLVWGAFILSWLLVSQYLPSVVSRWLVLPGIVSYSAYLLHYALVVALVDREPVGFAGSGGANALLNTLVFIVPGTFALATLTYLMVEKPFMQLRRRYLRDSTHS